MKNVLVVFNYNAGRKKGVKFKKTIVKFLLKNSEKFKFVTIEDFNNKDIEDNDTILVVGGDGSVSKVARLMVNTDKTLGIIPSGTANLLAAKLNIFPFSLKKSLNVIKRGKIKKIDVIKVNDKISTLRLGFGYDTDIIIKTPQSVKNKFGYFAYLISGFIFMTRLKKKKYEIILENEKIEEDLSVLIISKAPNLFLNMLEVGKNSKPDDNMADIFYMATTNPLIFLFEFIKIFFNIKTNSKYAKFIKTEKLKIKNTMTICHIDGEKEYLKDDIKILVMPKCLKVFVP